MGCQNCKEQEDIAKNSDKINDQLTSLIKRLELSFKRQKLDLESRINLEKAQVKSELFKSTMMRSKTKQQFLLENIVYQQDLITIYAIMIEQCKALITSKHLLPQIRNDSMTVNQPKVSGVRENLKVLIISVSIINGGKASVKNADLTRLQKLMEQHDKNTVPIPQKCRFEIINQYKRFTRPSFQQVNNFALGFCAQEDVRLSAFQEIGHSFKY